MTGPLTQRSFESFTELSRDTVSYLKERGFEYATPVQAAVLPLFRRNKDVVVDACTGSGKTLSFLLPILEKLRSLEKKHTRHDVLFIVISPTRELAIQTFRVGSSLFTTLTAFVVQRLVGGNDVQADIAAVDEVGANIIVGTPGKLSDIIKRKTPLNWSALEVLVLDEADRLLDLGFEKQLMEVIHALPKQRRTGLFSATQRSACEELVRAGLRNPIRVNVTTTMAENSEKVSDFSQRTPHTLSIHAAIVPNHAKLGHLVKFLSERRMEKTIVYGLTCACVEYWFYILRKLEPLQGLNLRALHGKMQQKGREKAINAFADDKAGVLLATDIAARGLDIPAIHWVIQMDAPQDPNAFVHRVGRTARMGRSGNACIFLSPNEESYIKFLQLRKIPIDRLTVFTEGEDYSQWQRRLSETEREAMLKGIAAYTSYIRAYSNHHCPYIFNLKKLDLGQLAYAFGLLYLPGMKEIKSKDLIDFKPSSVDPRSIEFADKRREAERERRQIKQLQETEAEKKKLFGKKSSRKKMRREKRKANSEREEQKPKVSRNAWKRDLEELEIDYKMYKLERKRKKGYKSEPVTEEIESDDC